MVRVLSKRLKIFADLHGFKSRFDLCTKSLSSKIDADLLDPKHCAEITESHLSDHKLLFPKLGFNRLF